MICIYAFNNAIEWALSKNKNKIRNKNKIKTKHLIQKKEEIPT